MTFYLKLTMKRRDKIFAFVKLRIGLINVRDFIGKLKIVIAAQSASVFRPQFCGRALSVGGYVVSEGTY